MTNAESLAGPSITRRDFVGGVLAAGTLAGCSGGTPAVNPDPWTGYAGVGDYAASNGNTRPVVDAAHRIRDSLYPGGIEKVPQVDEVYDLVIVGGGFSGLSAAYEFKKNGAGHCLVLDNHPVFGGEAKHNELVVDGVRLFAPQGSNDFRVPIPENGFANRLWNEIGMARSFSYREPRDIPAGYRIARDNFEPMYWRDADTSVGYYFAGRDSAPASMVPDIWRDRLARAPLSEADRAGLIEWRYGEAARKGAEIPDRELDRITYEQLLVDRLGLPATVARYADPLLATGSYGLGSDAISAYGARQLGLPCAAKVIGGQESNPRPTGSFPGGNSATLRHLLRAILPDAIASDGTLESVLSGPIRFDTLDRPGQKVRLRLGATTFHVTHAGPVDGAHEVIVAYARDGKLHRLRARKVVMATGGWVNRRVIADLGETQRAALAQFHHAPILVANVAVTNWRFMLKAGVSAMRWFDGDLGFFCNFRAPMLVDGKAPDLSPDRPTVLSFYISFQTPGRPLVEQAAAGRQRLFDTSFAGFEGAILKRLSDMFGGHGFDARRDVAAMILNRWGHAYIAPQPGFFFGADGNGGPGEVMRAGHGRISFGHCELTGRQTWRAAVNEGRRATRQALELPITD